MHVAIISGSHRPVSQSAKVAGYLVERLESPDFRHTTFLLDLGKSPLPLWDEGIRRGDPVYVGAWQPVSSAISECEAAIVIAPEWGGMVPAALKNFFLYAGDGCLYHKPGLLIGVSASRNGSYPIAELRASSYKNTHLQYISEHVIARHVGDVLNGAEVASEEDRYLRERIEYSLRVLIEYGKALRSVRESGVLSRDRYPFGM